MPIISGPSGAIQPVQMPDMVGNYGRLMQLKQMQQEAPLRQQEMQQQVDSGALDIQDRKLKLQDEQAMTSAMHEWSQSKPAASPAAGMGAAPSMPNYDDLVDVAKKHGASFNAVQGLQKFVLDMKSKAATIAKDDAQTGNDNANAMKTKNGMIIDAMTGVMNLPDQQLAPGLLSAAQELAGKGLLDPQHVQMAQQLAQSGDPAAIRKQLTGQIAGMGGFTKLLDDAQKKLDVQKKQGESDPNSPYYAPSSASVAMGTAPGAQAIKANEVRQAGLKSGAEAAARQPYEMSLARQRQALTQGQASGSATAGGPIDWTATAQKYGMTQGAFDQSAEKFATTGQLPPIGRNANAIAMNRDLMNRAAELHPAANLALNAGNFKASQESLKQVQKTYDMTHAFEQTAEKNMDLLQQTAQNIPELGSKFLNIPTRAISSSMIGTENMARFKTALQTAQTEAAKVLNNPGASGVLSDSARHELQGIVDGNMPYKSMVASLDTLKQDMSNRNTAYQDQINTIQERIKGGGGGNSSTGNSPGAAGKQRFTVNGRAYDIPANMVDEFKKDHPDAR